MRASIIIASIFAAFVAAAPAAAPVAVDSSAVEVEARQTKTLRVQLSDDATDTATQASIPANGQKISIKANFRGLPNNSRANRALIVSGSGSCNIFKDANAQQKVATIKSGAADARFTAVSLANGVIVCK